VFVIGGANSAGQGAIFLSQFASKVTLLKRGKSLEGGMSQYLIDQIYGTQNIEVLTQTEISAVHGSDRLEAITIRNHERDEAEKVPADAVFIFIGAAPHSEIVADT
jgi:thioredoxin reductase (NADPH)